MLTSELFFSPFSYFVVFMMILYPYRSHTLPVYVLCALCFYQSIKKKIEKDTEATKMVSFAGEDWALWRTVISHEYGFWNGGWAMEVNGNCRVALRKNISREMEEGGK